MPDLTRSAPGPDPWEGMGTLGLPLRARAPAWTACLVLLAFYLGSMSRDLGLYDSPELSLAAVQFGLSHPPGQPLHTWLGWLVSHLPGVPALWGLNALSALSGALCALCAFSLAEQLAPLEGWRAWLAAAVIVVFGTHPALWEPATRVEVYALATAFALWSAARMAALCREPTMDARVLFWPGVSLGLAAGANPYLGAFVALGALPRLTSLWHTGQVSRRAPVFAVAGGLLGLLPYLHVPLVAGRTDAFVWGAPHNWANAVHYFRGLDYGHNREIDAATIISHAADWFPWAQSTGLLLPFALAAVAYGARAFRSLGLSFGLITFGLGLLMFSSNAVWTPDVPDYLCYLLPALWAFTAGAASAASAHWGRHGAVLAGLCAAACLLATPRPWERTRHRDTVARQLAQGVLDEAPPGAIVLVGADHFIAPLLYLQGAEGRRPDVVLVGYGLGSSSWFWEQLSARHPNLAPFALRGPGGREGRIHRFLQAQAERPVLVQTPALARAVGMRVCPGRWLWRARMPCAQGEELEVAARTLARLRGELGTGTPTSPGALAAVALERGEYLWRFGLAQPALTTLLSAVQPALYGKVPALQNAPALQTPLPRWSRPADLGDPARNLMVASSLAHAGGQFEQAVQWLTRAAELQLPEALAAVGAAP